MALKDIIDKIEKNVEERIAELESEHNEAVKKLEKNLEHWETNELDKAKQEAEKIKEKKVNQLVRAKESALRKELLAEKQNLLSTIFDEAEKQVLNFDNKNYCKVFINIIDKLGVKEGAIHAGSDEKKRLDKEFIDELNKALKAEFDTDIDYTKDFERGLVIKSGKVRYDLSIPALMSDLRDRIEEDIIEQLF